ncbi:SPFH domain-containing protein [Demequina iriomotensis]|uniref:SPFH domain-containing protein n=1 Tax=Demequina iriomotensis TaxID=1536641 RepID=UPI0007803038|nr:flotillin family protein [Demequina iriomotensis]
MFNLDGSAITLIAIAASVVAAVVVVWAIASRYKVSDPDEAFVVSGSKSKTQVAVRQADGTTTFETRPVPSKVVLGGGGVFVVPFTQRYNKVSLETRQIAWRVQDSPSNQNILVNLEGVANVKIGGDEASVRAAIERFNVNPLNIEAFVQQNIEGDMRAIVGTMSVEDINSDRETLKDRVMKVTGEACSEWGLVLEGLNIQSVTTPSGYIQDLGRRQAAIARRDAEIAEAEARRESEQKRAAAEQQIAEANRTLALRMAEIQQDTDTAEANAKAAGPIAEAQRNVEIFEQERLAEAKRAEVTEMRLESEVRKPADAGAYAMKVEAEAAREAAISKAKGAAEATRQAGESEAAANQARGLADAAVFEARGRASAAADEAVGVAAARVVEAQGLAEASSVKARGEAEATAIAAKGKAEAEGIEAKKTAYENMPQVGVLEIALDGMPAIVGEMGKAMAAIDTLTVVSTEGASAVTRQAANLFTETEEVMNSVTGFGISDLIKGAVGGAAAGRAAVEAGHDARLGSADPDLPGVAHV